MAHVPPPPHAEGRKIFSLASVESSELPADTVIVFSPLMVTVTGPDCTRRFWAMRSSTTSSRMTTVNVMMEEEMIGSMTGQT
jgi:hypothetical protein